jgi:pimeloyl-ACP methyl ester carboxylesterase
MPGFAGAPPQVDPSFEKWERAIAEFIRSNNIVKPVIIGYSMGGGLALALAADYPELIGEIIVVDALPCLQALSNPTFKSIANNDCSQSIKQMTEMTEQQFYQMQKMSIPRLLTDTSKQEEVIHWSVMSDRTTFASVYCDFWNVDLREKIKTINCPNLILLESYFVNIKSSVEEQYKGLSNANLKYANKGLHFIMYDDKEWYFSQLTKFLAVE